MSQASQNQYRFGDFHLVPAQRQLFKHGNRLNLPSKSFDLLRLLIERAGNLVTESEILQNIWTDEFVNSENISVRISGIRKVLGDSAKSSTFIETVPKHGYRFCFPVERIFVSESEDASEINEPLTRSTRFTPTQRENTEDGQLEVESHKFVPMFVGRELFVSVIEIEERSNWALYKKFHTDHGTLYVLPYGVGVWHLNDSLKFDSVTDLALWRRRTYQEIKSGKHIVCEHARTLTQDKRSLVSESFQGLVAQADYVLSVFVLKKPKWHLAEQITSALKMLCCPTPLQSEDIEDLTKEEALAIETDLLEKGFQNPDIKEFGLPPNDIGYASWAGVSYHQATIKHGNLVKLIVDLEIAIQAAWYFASCIKNICLNSEDNIKEKLDDEIGFLIRHVGKIKSIGSTEPMSVRTMHEAILTTSRLEKLVDDRVELYRQLVI